MPWFERIETLQVTLPSLHTREQFFQVTGEPWHPSIVKLCKRERARQKLVLKPKPIIDFSHSRRRKILHAAESNNDWPLLFVFAAAQTAKDKSLAYVPSAQGTNIKNNHVVIMNNCSFHERANPEDDEPLKISGP